MPWPRSIITMAQNLIIKMGSNPELYENGFHMLWNSMLFIIFPLHLKYGVSPETPVTDDPNKGSKPSFKVVKLAREEESIVLVVKIKGLAEDTVAGREKVKAELLEDIKERFAETKFPSIYGIGGIGLSWAAFKMDVSGPSELELIVDWSSNITSIQSFDKLLQLGTMIDQMTGTSRDMG